MDEVRENTPPNRDVEERADEGGNVAPGPGSRAIDKSAAAANRGTNDLRGGTGLGTGTNRGGVAAQDLGGGAGGVGSSREVFPGLGGPRDAVGSEDPGGEGDLTGGLGGDLDTSRDDESLRAVRNPRAPLTEERDGAVPAPGGAGDVRGTMKPPEKPRPEVSGP